MTEREIERLLQSDAESEPAYIMPDGTIETMTDRVGLIFMNHVHSNVPEEQRPKGWADFSDDQISRIRTAAREAIAAWQAAAPTPSPTDAHRRAAEEIDFLHVRGPDAQSKKERIDEIAAIIARALGTQP